MIVAAVLGAWLGAGFVARWPRRRIQIGMGTALIAAAMLMELSQLGVLTAGGSPSSWGSGGTGSNRWDFMSAAGVAATKGGRAVSSS